MKVLFAVIIAVVIIAVVVMYRKDGFVQDAFSPLQVSIKCTGGNRSPTDKQNTNVISTYLKERLVGIALPGKVITVEYADTIVPAAVMGIDSSVVVSINGTKTREYSLTYRQVNSPMNTGEIIYIDVINLMGEASAIEYSRKLLDDADFLANSGPGGKYEGQTRMLTAAPTGQDLFIVVAAKDRINQQIMITDTVGRDNFRNLIRNSAINLKLIYANYYVPEDQVVYCSFRGKTMKYNLTPYVYEEIFKQISPEVYKK